MALGSYAVQLLDGRVLGAMWVCIASTAMIMPTSMLWEVAQHNHVASSPQFIRSLSIYRPVSLQ